jgi:hypothetical protein
LIRPIGYDPGDQKLQMEIRRDFIDTFPYRDDQLPLLEEPRWVPSDVATGNSQDGKWMKLQL